MSPSLSPTNPVIGFRTVRPAVIASAIRLSLAIFALFCLGSIAFAQSTATPVQPGYVDTNNCPSGFTACWHPYTNANPLPVSPSAPSGTQDTNLKQINGATVNVGAGAAGTGTQRVTTSTDSTIGTVTAVTAITNALPAGTNNIGTVSGSTVGGYEFNASVIPTVQNAAYAAGQSLGGLQTISIGSTNSLTGILDQIALASTSGSTVAVVVYVWDKNPTNTTCTDKTNFVKSQTDNQHLVTGLPILLSPALVVSAQDTSTYAAATNLTDNFVNSSSNTSLYACILANASVTPGTTSDYRLNLQGVKDQP